MTKNFITIPPLYLWRLLVRLNRAFHCLLQNCCTVSVSEWIYQPAMKYIGDCYSGIWSSILLLTVIYCYIHAVTYCNILLHSVTCCNILLHTVTYCNRGILWSILDIQFLNIDSQPWKCFTRFFRSLFISSTLTDHLSNWVQSKRCRAAQWDQFKLRSRLLPSDFFHWIFQVQIVVWFKLNFCPSDWDYMIQLEKSMGLRV